MQAETRDVRVLVLTGYGLNCEVETAAGFSRAGATVVSTHLHDVLERANAKDVLAEYNSFARV